MPHSRGGDLDCPEKSSRERPAAKDRAGLKILRHLGAREGGRTLRQDVFLPSKHLLSAFYEKLPSKNPSKNLVVTETPLQAPSKNPSKKRLLLENLLRTLLRSVRLHDPLGVRPSHSKQKLCVVDFTIAQ